MNSYQKTLGILMDLSKTFDTVSHPILTKHLKEIGIISKVLLLFKLCIKNRIHKINIEDLVSKNKLMTSDVQ